MSPFSIGRKITEFLTFKIFTFLSLLSPFSLSFPSFYWDFPLVSYHLPLYSLATFSVWEFLSYWDGCRMSIGALFFFRGFQSKVWGSLNLVWKKSNVTVILILISLYFMFHFLNPNLMCHKSVKILRIVLINTISRKQIFIRLAGKRLGYWKHWFY